MSTSVKIIWFIDKTEHNVGIYNPLNVTNFHTSMNASDLPKDRLDNVYDLIPLYLLQLCCMWQLLQLLSLLQYMPYTSINYECLQFDTNYTVS